MQPYQRTFLELAIEHEVLRFGDFTLKSGRQSPYFFNMGLFQTGQALNTVGCCFAEALLSAKADFDVLFGPAYKGIPLVSATAIAFAQKGKSIPYSFNRKEIKDHGEGGQIVGAPLTGRVMLIDDVITAGTAVREVIPLIESSGAKLSGIIIALDRQEKGLAQKSALTELAESLQINTYNIINLSNIIEYLSSDPKQASNLEKLEAYRQTYGAL